MEKRSWNETFFGTIFRVIGGFRYAAKKSLWILEGFVELESDVKESNRNVLFAFLPKKAGHKNLK
jgi:hypothetical protein